MIKYKIGKYLPTDLMSDLICDNYPMLLVMSRFGIDLGFGESSIEEVCRKSNVDVDTFLAVVNVLISGDKVNDIQIDYNKVSLPQLVCYLHNSHTYFLEYRLPSIRQKLVDSLERDEDVSVVIVNYYDGYVAEVNKHMMYEENTLFPYVTSIVEGKTPQLYSIDEYSKHHDKIESKLSELKSILIKYYPAQTTHKLNNVLYDILACEQELASHNGIEDFLLVPIIRMVEFLERGQ